MTATKLNKEMEKVNKEVAHKNVHEKNNKVTKQLAAKNCKSNYKKENKKVQQHKSGEMKGNKSAAVRSQSASKAVRCNQGHSTPVKLKAVNVKSSTQSLLGNNPMQIILDRSNVDNYLS